MFLKNNTHSIHGTGIFTYIWLKCSWCFLDNCIAGQEVHQPHCSTRGAIFIGQFTKRLPRRFPPCSTKLEVLFWKQKHIIDVLWDEQNSTSSSTTKIWLGTKCYSWCCDPYQSFWLIVKVSSRFLPLNHQSNGSGVILSLPKQFIGSTGMVHFTRKNMQTTFASYASYPSTFHQHCQKQKRCPFQPNGRFSYPYYRENRVGTQHRNSIFYSRHQKHCEEKKQPPCRIDAGLEGIFLGEGLTFGSLSTGRGWGCKGFNLARQLLSSWQHLTDNFRQVCDISMMKSQKM